MTARLGLALGVPPGPAERPHLLACARIADELGIDSLWVAEAAGRDAVSFLTELALATERVLLGSGIINPFSRTPALLAMTFAALDERSGGRMLIGLGSSGANTVEHWHGVRFTQPLRRIRETVQIINAILAGGPLDHAGSVFELRRGLRLQFTPARPHIPIYVAATTPPSIRQAGEVADGVMPIHWPRHHLGDLRAEMAAGAQAAGRANAPLAIAPSMSLVIDGDAELDRRAREALAQYAGRMGAAYPAMLARYGFEADVAAIRAAWERGPHAAAQAVSDALLDATAIVGGIDQCAAKLAEVRAAGGDLPIIPLPPGDAAAVGRILERLIR